MILPSEAHPLLLALAPAFTAPASERFRTLLATSLRTVANLLRTIGPRTRLAKHVDL